jgi:hypothetical protein
MQWGFRKAPKQQQQQQLKAIVSYPNFGEQAIED